MNRSIFPALKAGLSRLYRQGDAPPPGPANPANAYIERRAPERRRFISDFRLRESRLGVAAQTAQLGIYDLDFATQSNYWSAELKAIAGLPKVAGDVPLGLLRQLVHPEDRERVMGRMEASLSPNGDGRFDEEYRLVRPDGTVRWVKVRGQTYFAADGQGRRVLGASGIVIDITDQKLAEAKLKESEARFRSMADASPSLIWIANTHRGCIWFNQAWLAFTGRTLEQEAGEGWTEAVHPEDRQRILLAYEAAFNRRGPFYAEYRIRRHDGEYRWLYDQGVPRFEGEAFVGYIGSAMDITDFKEAQANLEESHSRQEAILEGVSEGVIIFDLTGQVLNMNPAARRMLRYSTPEEARRRLPEFTDEFDARDLDGRSLPLDEWPIGRVIRGESFMDYDIILHRKDDGSSTIISHNGTPVPNQQGETILGVLTLQDVTESRQSARALRESERRLAVALSASGSAVWEMRVDDGIIRGEDRLFTMLGYAPGDLKTIGDWHGLVHDEDREGVSEALDEVIEGKRESCRFELRARTRDGHWRWVLSQAAAAERDPRGRAIRLVGTHTDIDQRKQTEEALRLESSRLQSILDHAPLLIWIRDIEGRVALANRAFFETVDVPPPGEFIGRSIFELFPKGVAKQVWADDQWALENEAPIRREASIPHRDGGRHAYLTVTFPVSDVETGAPRSICSISLNISELKSAEERIRELNADLEHRVQARTAELEQANEALLESNTELRHFARAMAHDLQTPLRSIAGFAQLLQRESQGQGNERVDEYASLVVENTKRLQSLIMEILSYTRLEGQGMPFETVDLGDLLDGVVASLEALIGEKGAQVSHGELPTLSVDRIQISQVLQNLIENAIKYNESRPPKVHVDCELQEDEWVFSVADNGIGVDPRHHERIFEIFRRLHAYHQVPGSGIGLALCRRIVERHGGRIWLDSQPGKGSTFYFSLPAKGKDEEAGD